AAVEIVVDGVAEILRVLELSLVRIRPQRRRMILEQVPAHFLGHSAAPLLPLLRLQLFALPLLITLQLLEALPLIRRKLRDAMRFLVTRLLKRGRGRLA